MGKGTSGGNWMPREIPGISSEQNPGAAELRKTAGGGGPRPILGGVSQMGVFGAVGAWRRRVRWFRAPTVLVAVGVWRWRLWRFHFLAVFGGRIGS